MVTLDLTIIHSNTGIDSQTACDSYTWRDGNTYTASTNAPQQTFTNMAGCDSVVTLDLTINHSSTGIDSQTACDSYTWTDGKTYASNTNTPQQTLRNVAGCDSVVTLNLVINYRDSIDMWITRERSYTWNGREYSESGDYTWRGVSQYGCDSVVVLHLTVTGQGHTDGIMSADEAGISVYPNPTHGTLSIDGDAVQEVEVLDIQGRKVASFANANRIDISHLQTGVYSLRILTQTLTAFKRIVKAK